MIVAPEVSQEDAGPSRTARRFAWAGWALIALLAVALVVLATLNQSIWSSGLGANLKNGPDEGDYAMFWLIAVMGIGYATLGALIVSRRGNPIGWILFAFSFSLIWIFLCEQYGLRSVGGGAGSLPGATLVAAAGPLGSAGIAGMGVLFLLFPTGSPPSARWRPVIWMSIGGAVLYSIGFGLRPGPLNGPWNDLGIRIQNPIGIEPLKGVLAAVFAVGVASALLGAMGGAIALVRRFRRSAGEERQQIKWLAFMAGAALVVFVVGFPLSALFPGDHTVAGDVWFSVFFLTLVVGVPVSAAIAILKYRLYDLDLVINKTVVYGLLAAFITAVYVGIVVGIGQAIGSKRNLGLSILATAVVAVGFQPVRNRVQHFANRLVYGKRATPYEVLSEFSGRMSGAYATEDLLPRMARILAEGTGATRADVWLHVGNDLHPEASWPTEGLPHDPIAVSGEDIPAIEGIDRLLPVRHHGELLGALSITKARGDPIRPAEEKLMEDLASGAGLVLRNVRLTAELLARLEELKRSRQRIVAAQDEERRRLERNLHDGAQQQLVALQVRLSLAERVAEEGCRLKDSLSALKQEAGEALENLRDLARGIYPPLLADQGLAAALRAQARKATFPVTVEADHLSRYPQDQEAAVYFCCLEALQNVAKYAGATHATVRLFEADGQLAFEVTDDGAGFDTVKTSYGTGLLGMADRLSAQGGTLEVRSHPREGTTITGRVPVRALEVVGA
jgi:signal transduction histidine kinase